MGKIISKNSEEVLFDPITFCYCLAQYAKDYVKETTESSIKKDIKDAVLVTFINNTGYNYNVLMELKVKELYNDLTLKGKVKGEDLLQAALLDCYCFIDKGICETVLNENDTHNCSEPFDEELGLLILADFMNYMAKRNGLKPVLTVDNLYRSYKEKEYNIRMEELREFLLIVEEYSQRLSKGYSIDDIYEEIAEVEELLVTSSDGEYCDLEGNEMDPITNQRLNQKWYALAYAYAKLNPETEATEELKNIIIKEKILEMRNRK